MTDLSSKKCVPCEGGTMPLQLRDIEPLLAQVKEWRLGTLGRSISKEFTFKNFADALAFTNKVGEIAEREGHHPDIMLSWGKVGIELSTHAIGGLSENDFILAAKIDELSSVEE